MGHPRLSMIVPAVADVRESAGVALVAPFMLRGEKSTWPRSPHLQNPPVILEASWPSLVCGRHGADAKTAIGTGDAASSTAKGNACIPH